MIAHNKKYTLVGLVGKSGAGKDEIFTRVKKILGHRIHPVLHYTTRSPRSNEKSGIHYYFTDKYSFRHFAQKGEYLTAECFNDWWYGILRQDLYQDRINFAILNPKEAYWLQNLHPDPDVEIYLYYLDVADDILVTRLTSTRSDQAEVIRRIKADEEDHKKYTSNLLFERVLSNDTIDELHYNVGFICGQIEMVPMVIDKYIDRTMDISYKSFIDNSHI